MSFADLLQDDGSEGDTLPPLPDDRVIQHDTLAGWVNTKINPLGLQVHDLRREMRDGVKLCRLLEAVRGQRVGKVVQREPVRPLEAAANISLALDVMQKDGAWVTNADTDSIRAGELEPVLGVLWSMVRRYALGTRARLPPRKHVLSWCNAALAPRRRVSNLTTDWNDGVALLGIVEYCHPGLRPNWHSEKGQDGVSVGEVATQLGEGILRVPPILSGESLSSQYLDEVSLVTYLSLYLEEGGPAHQATLDWAQRQVGADRVTNFTTDWNDGYVLSAIAANLECHVAGWPNINTSDGNGTNQNALSAVRDDLMLKPTITARELASPTVDPVAVIGLVAWLRTRAPDDPSPPPAAPPPPDAGYEDDETGEGRFLAGAGNPGYATVGAVMVDPEGGETMNGHGRGGVDPEDGTGRGSLDMGQFAYHAPETEEAPMGPAIQLSIPKQWRVKAIATIVVDSSLEGPGAIHATAVSPSGDERPLTQSHVEKFRCHLLFKPSEPGLWQLRIQYMDLPVPGSPHQVAVYDPSLALIQKDADTGSTGVPYSFTVEAGRGGSMPLDVFVLNDGVLVPHMLSADHQGVGSHVVTFTPAARGVHTVSVFTGGCDVMGSPFKVNIVESDGESLGQRVLSTDVHASSASLASQILEHQGSHLIPEKWMLGQTATLQFDTSPVGYGAIRVTVVSPGGHRVPLSHLQVDHFNHHFSFTPGVKGEWQVSVQYGDAEIPGSPFPVHVYEATAVQVQRFIDTATVGEMVKFEVDVSGAEGSDLDVFVIAEGHIVDHTIEEDGVSKHRVTFRPTKVGAHTVHVFAGGGKVRGAPFEIDVTTSSHDQQSIATGAGGVLVSGSGLKRAVVNMHAHFTIDTSVSPGPVAIGVTGPNDEDIHYVAQQKGGGRVEVAYTPTVPGRYTVEVQQNEAHVTGSPFSPLVEGGAVLIRDLRTHVSVGTLSSFTIDATNASKGKLELDSELSIQKFDRAHSQMYRVTFTTFRVGLYDLVVRYDGRIVPGCPYQIEARH